MLIEEQGHHTHTTNLHQIKQSLKVLVLAEPCAEMPFNDLLSLSLSVAETLKLFVFRGREDCACANMSL